MPKPSRIVVLTYHSANISGNCYATNDHVALQIDLGLLSCGPYRVSSLDDALAAVPLVEREREHRCSDL